MPNELIRVNGMHSKWLELKRREKDRDRDTDKESSEPGAF